MFRSNFHGQRDTSSLAWYYYLALAVCVEIPFPSQNLEVHCGCDMTAAVRIYIQTNQEHDTTDTQFLATDQERMKEQNTAYRPYLNTSKYNQQASYVNNTIEKHRIEPPCHPHKMAL